MKKYLFPLLAAFALTAGAANAQTTPQNGGGRPSPEQMAARQSERITKQLGLNADQTTKVQQIMAARDQEMQGMRGQMQGGTATRGQMRDQMVAGRAKYDDQFKAVLTPDQYTKYTAMQADRMQRGPGRGMGPRRGMAQDSTAKKGKVKVRKDKMKVKAE
ncbi:hypothetical protein [Hymenobacter coccineus]|uniref:DUF4890 domain-containing protein n=1 Tax=Hymenobacter coccineus TaxID=1908235 RepID=A0A1G1TGT0_9BACT|nr:hypothetical protein [Hymenobacter coccineus]OGX90091.1 hypothetical protein BEN49_07535 [Hymenobacter coccineus]